MEILGCRQSEDLRTDRAGLVTNRNHSNRRVTNGSNPAHGESHTDGHSHLKRRGFRIALP
jgi:hypothetical protein